MLTSAGHFSNDEIWRILLSRAAPERRARVQKSIGFPNLPPFFQFVMETLEKAAAAGRLSLTSAPLLDSGIVVNAIAEPAILDLESAILLARVVVQLDPQLDDKLLKILEDRTREWPDVPEAKAARVFEVIDAISTCQRLVLPLMKFLKIPTHQLRSKVVKLIARARSNAGWSEAILADPDPRVRSNLIEGLSPHKGEQINQLLKKAAIDPHHRVAVTALLQLCLRGDCSACDRLIHLSKEGDPPHKRAAEWALHQSACTKKEDSPCGVCRAERASLEPQAAQDEAAQDEVAQDASQPEAAQP